MRSRHTLRVLFLTVTVTAVAACADDSDSPFEERIVDGVVELHYRESVPPDLNPYEIQLAATYGENQSEETYLFGAADIIGQHPNGTVLVSDGSESLIYRFSEAGELLSTFGGRGQGPGELSDSFLELLHLDELLIWDNGNGRLSRFGVDGDFLGQTLFRELPLARQFAPVSRPRGSAYAAVELGTSYAAGATSRTAMFSVHLLDEELQKIATPINMNEERVPAFIGPVGYFPMFEFESPRVGLVPERPLVWSYGREYRIDFMEFGTDRRWAVIVPHPARPLRTEHREREYRGYASFQAEEEARRSIQHPANLPHLDLLRWDETGRLWVREYVAPGDEPESFVFDVFRTDGTWLFRQELPVTPDLITATGFFDEAADGDENPVIHFYRWLRSPPDLSHSASSARPGTRPLSRTGTFAPATSR